MTQKQFTKAITGVLRNVGDGWSASELRYTPIQPVGRGRPRAIDFFYEKSRVAVELELSNQTCLSHDLLKLEVAFRGGLIDCGALLVVTESLMLGWEWNRGTNNSYLTYETAQVFFRVFEPALTVPVVLLGTDF